MKLLTFYEDESILAACVLRDPALPCGGSLALHTNDDRHRSCLTVKCSAIRSVFLYQSGAVPNRHTVPIIAVYKKKTAAKAAAA